MKRRSFILGVLVLFLLPGIALAAFQVDGNDSLKISYVYLYENSIGDSSDGNDYMLEYRSNQILSGLTHTLPGYCNDVDPVDPADDWNNCVSSIRPVWRDSSKKLCLYDNPNGSLGIGEWAQYTYAQSRNNVRVNMSAIAGHIGSDALGEIKWIPASQPCQP